MVEPAKLLDLSYSLHLSERRTKKQESEILNEPDSRDYEGQEANGFLVLASCVLFDVVSDRFFR